MASRHKSGTKGVFDGPSPDVGKATQFQPGMSGNPNGRPRTRELAELLRSIGDELVGKGKRRHRRAERMLRKFYQRAESHSDRAAIEILDRIDGKIPQSHEVSGPDGTAIPVNIGDIDNELRSLLASAGSRISDSRGKGKSSKVAGAEKAASGADEQS